MSFGHHMHCHAEIPKMCENATFVEKKTENADYKPQFYKLSRPNYSKYAQNTGQLSQSSNKV